MARASGKSRVLPIMPKILEISVEIQMERSVAVSFDRNIRDHLWNLSGPLIFRLEIRRSIFYKQVLFGLIREFAKGIKSRKSHSY